MLGIAGAAAFRAGYFRERLSDVLGEVLRQEGVESAQAVVGVGYVYEPGLHSPVQQGAVDRLCGHDLAHVSDVHGTGWGYARGYGVGAGAFQLFCDDISPVNRHRQKSMLKRDINLVVAARILDLPDYDARTMVPLMAMKNRTENSIPSTLSSMKAFLIQDLERPSIFGRAGGSMKKRVPERKTVAL